MSVGQITDLVLDPIDARQDSMSGAFKLYSSGLSVAVDISDRVISVEYEAGVDAIAMLTVELDNTDFGASDSALFKPGVPLDVFMGYGTDLKHVGRGFIIRHRPTFPDSGVPILVLKAYDISYKMGKPKAKSSGGAQPTKAGEGLHAEGQPRKGDIKSIVEAIMRDYEIEPDVDAALAKYTVEHLVQKRGTTDLAFLRATANLYSAWMWYEYVPDSDNNPRAGKWIGHFLLPPSIKQDKQYTFRWARGPESTLRDLTIEYAIETASTEVQGLIWNKKTRSYMIVKVNDPTEAKKIKGGKGGGKKAPLYSEETPFAEAVGGTPSGKDGFDNDLLGEQNLSHMRFLTAGQSVDFWIGGVTAMDTALRIVTNMFESQKDSMILATGSHPGVEEVRAGQIHRLEGIGDLYSGEYTFATVKHVWSQDGGYVTSFNGRKILESKGSSFGSGDFGLVGVA